MTRPMMAYVEPVTWRNQPQKNFQTCDIRYADEASLHRTTPRANVTRFRKTKRSAWVVEVSVVAQIPRGSVAELREYVTAIADCVDAIVWPVEEINP